MKRKFKTTYKAYSLIELSIVLVIISVLIAGAMVVSVENVKSDKERITRERIDAIYKQTVNYLRVNRAIPCPASLAKVRSVDTDYGVAGNCTANAGVLVWGNYIKGAVPCATLGLPHDYCEDAFGSKFTYYSYIYSTVAADTTAAPNFGVDNFSTMANYQLTASPPISLWEIYSNPTGVTSATNVLTTYYAVLVVISHGPNKFGAYNANSSTQNGASTDEGEQFNYGSSNAIIASVPLSDVFDDIVFYKTTKDLLADFPDLMNLVPCNNVDASYINGAATGDSWYGGIVYSAKNVCGSPNEDNRFSKRCSENGVFLPVKTTCGSSCN